MNIKDYSFHDDDLELDFDNSDLNTANLTVFYQDFRDGCIDCDVSFHLVKRDVIALAKHFKLTNDDSINKDKEKLSSIRRLVNRGDVEPEWAFDQIRNMF